jgi:hypothetical protein
MADYTLRLGMRGTGDWSSDERPKDFDNTVLYLWPNGQAPLTAMKSRLSKSKAKDPEFNWWNEELQSQAGTITGKYTDSGLSTAYDGSSPLADGGLIYLKMAEADSKAFREGHTVLIRDTGGDDSKDRHGKVLKSVQEGDASFICVRMLEADTDGAIAACERVVVYGNVNPEGGAAPDSITTDPTKYTNYTQIFRTTYDITRTAMETYFRTGDPIKKMRRGGLQMHTIEQEKSFIWGIPTEKPGKNGKPERTTGGLIYCIKTFASDNVFNFYTSTETGIAGKSWLARGKRWLDEKLEQVFRYGRDTKLAYCGSGALLGINQLAEEYGTIQIQTRQASFGIKVGEWVTPFGTLLLKTHPLFSYEPTDRNAMVVFEPENLEEQYITPTKFKPDPYLEKAGFNSIDAIKEEYLTETGLRYNFPKTAAFFNGVGRNNTTYAGD